jgi:hypothetical protein
MQDEFSSRWLTAVEPVWSGHHAALSARLARPLALRLTEEQESLAFGLLRRLIADLAGRLPLASDRDAIWTIWEANGVPDAEVVVPAVMARVEEYRWRRMISAPIAEVPMSLFIHSDTDSAPEPVVIDGTADLTPEVDGAYLALRIADAARSDAMGQPLLPPSELNADLLRGLLLDIAAQDLALTGDGGTRAGDLAAAVDTVLADVAHGSINEAARRYAAAVLEAGLVAEIGRAAISDRDWLALVALVSSRLSTGFAPAAAALIAADDREALALLADMGMDAACSAPLLDALAELPARPQRGATLRSAQLGGAVADLAAREALLREVQP